MFNLEALFDIALKNIPDKFIDIIALVPDPTELWTKFMMANCSMDMEWISAMSVVSL